MQYYIKAIEMFSIFKSKNPFSKQINESEAMNLAELCVDESIKSAKRLLEWIKTTNKETTDEGDKAESISIADAAFEYWVFNLYLIFFIVLLKNMKENGDKSIKDFANPVFSYIYDASKAIFEFEYKKLSDAKYSN